MAWAWALICVCTAMKSPYDILRRHLKRVLDIGVNELEPFSHDVELVYFRLNPTNGYL